MRASAKSTNQKRKTNLKRYRELGMNPCKACGTMEGTVSYQYVQRGGDTKWVTHCSHHKQTPEKAEANRRYYG